jgi:bifunctional oligoribonuclease and PAP phosphatase NrnA
MNNNFLFSSADVQGAFDLINRSEQITLLTHVRPDGDAIGSCLAMAFFLEGLGKRVETIYPTEPELSGVRKPSCYFVDRHKQKPDLLIACDTANAERMYYPEEFKKVPLINIDHHVSNSINGDFNFIGADASSACEVLHSLLVSWNAESITKGVAEALLYGIMDDTNIFRTQSTYPSTLRVAADLIEKGADLFKLKIELLSSKNPGIIRLWSRILDRIDFNAKHDATWTYVAQKDLRELGLDLKSIVGFSNYLSEISGIDITIFFYELETGATQVSLRSKNADVNLFASRFGGGGHKNASGILMQERLELAIEKVTKAL